MIVRIPRELVSPNHWNGMHWRQKHRLTQGWERDIWALTSNRLSAVVHSSYEVKKRVTVTREVPSKRNFIRDTDNLFGACKPLLDALQRLGLVVHDSERWLDLPRPQQRVSADGKFWTVVEIDQVEA